MRNIPGDVLLRADGPNITGSGACHRGHENVTNSKGERKGHCEEGKHDREKREHGELEHSDELKFRASRGRRQQKNNSELRGRKAMRRIAGEAKGREAST